jgi:hypothetical protein
MLQLLTQAIKKPLTDEPSSEDRKKIDKSNGMWIFLCWDQNTNHLRVIHDTKESLMRKSTLMYCVKDDNNWYNCTTNRG